MEKILIIDDERKILNILSELLTMRGYRVLTARSGHEGIKIFKEEAPPLLIVDIIMPGVDGIEVLNEIKRLSSNTEVIMITAYEDSDLAIKSLHFEASDFITKPINSDELFISIKRAEEKLLLKKQLQEYTNNLEKLVKERTRRMLKLEKQATIGNLIQGIANNIQDPLSVIATRAEFLSWKLKETGDVLSQCREYIENFKQIQLKMEKNIQDVETILKNARCITAIIENIIVKSIQDQSDKEELIDINQMIQREVMFFDSHLYFKNKIEKRYHLDHNIDNVRMVYSDLSLIFDNLIKSAIDAMYNSPKKKLTINTWQDEKNIYVDFIYTGVGIPADKIKDIPFFSTKKRIDGQTASEPAGSDLGLYTCVSLIRKYGGNIEVKSGFNEGAKFRVLIPRQ